MMIEAVDGSALSGRALRRVAWFCEATPTAVEPMLGRDDFHFFLGAYLGALVFFLAWLA